MVHWLQRITLIFCLIRSYAKIVLWSQRRTSTFCTHYSQIHWVFDKITEWLIKDSKEKKSIQIRLTILFKILGHDGHLTPYLAYDIETCKEHKEKEIHQNYNRMYTVIYSVLQQMVFN